MSSYVTVKKTRYLVTNHNLLAILLNLVYIYNLGMTFTDNSICNMCYVSHYENTCMVFLLAGIINEPQDMCLILYVRLSFESNYLKKVPS